MRLETFSYLPALSGEQLERQIRAILDRGLVVSIEYTTAPDPRDHYWAMWKLPLFGSADPAAVLTQLDACRQANPGAFIKVNGYDRTRQGQVVSFVASRPAGESLCRGRSC
jgi:ribulose-bisphosphate carboxylase small chain